MKEHFWAPSKKAPGGGPPSWGTGGSGATPLPTLTIDWQKKMGCPRKLPQFHQAFDCGLTNKK